MSDYYEEKLSEVQRSIDDAIIHAGGSMVRGMQPVESLLTKS
jgi:hypothetical protein